MFCFKIHFVFGLVQAVLIAGVMCSNTGDPGLKTRVTQNGLNYATAIAIDVLSPELKGIHIPNYADKSGRTTYNVSNMSIRKITKPRSHVSIVPETGLKWSVYGIDIDVKGDWYFYYDGWWFFNFWGSGYFKAWARDISIDVTVSVVKDDQGSPSISTQSCTGNIGAVGLTVHGSKLSWLYNWFTGSIARRIKSFLKPKMCDLIRNFVDKDIAGVINNLPITWELYKDLYLDYGFVSDPQFTSTFIETYHKGDIIWLSNTTGLSNANVSSNGTLEKTPVTSSESSLPILQNITEEDKMYYLSASDYILNRLAYQAQKHGYLTYNVTSQDLPDSVSGVLNTSCTTRICVGMLLHQLPGFASGVLNTSCTTGICVGMLLHQIGHRYPGRQVELRMHTAQTPEVHIRNGSIGITGSGFADLYVITKDAEDYIFSLNASLDTSVSVSIRNGTVYGKMRNLDIGISIVNSAIGGIGGQLLQNAVNRVIKTFVEPQLNAAGRRGYEIPVIMNLRVANTKMTLMENTLIVGTDIEFLHDDEI